MSSEQLRYRTLVNNIGRVYASEALNRTALLQTGLGEIMDAIKPASTTQWGIVKADSERLLTVWSVKEGGDAATAVVAQLRDILQELSSAAAIPVSFPVRGPDSITHVQNAPAFSFSFPTRDAFIRAPAPVISPVVVTPPTAEIKSVTISAPSLEVEEVEGEVEEEVEEVEEEVEEVEEEVEEEKVVEPTPEVEEEEEDDGMEVEQITIRGRTYWIDTGSQKLYANAEGDEVGDEVGALVNGKPVFLAK
jgi:hypothetical protein